MGEAVGEDELQWPGGKQVGSDWVGAVVVGWVVGAVVVGCVVGALLVVGGADVCRVVGGGGGGVVGACPGSGGLPVT